jgi:hypothetical protein
MHTQSTIRLTFITLIIGILSACGGGGGGSASSPPRQ